MRLELTQTDFTLAGKVAAAINKSLGTEGAPPLAQALDARVVRVSVQRGEPLLDGKLAPLGTKGGLSAVIGEGKRAIDETNDRVRAMLEVNLVGLFTLSRQAATVMLANGEGSIINIASVLGLVASAPVQQAAYCAAKGGVVNLTRQLGAEWGRKGVRVNAIAPGWFHSEMTAETMFDDPAAMDFVLRETPMGRAGEADELDGALLFLASGASRFVTGITLPVDGGWTAR